VCGWCSVRFVVCIKREVYVVCNKVLVFVIVYVFGLTRASVSRYDGYVVRIRVEVGINTDACDAGSPLCAPLGNDGGAQHHPATRCKATDQPADSNLSIRVVTAGHAQNAD